MRSRPGTGAKLIIGSPLKISYLQECERPSYPSDSDMLQGDSPRHITAERYRIRGIQMATEFGGRSELGKSESREISQSAQVASTMALVEEYWRTERNLGALQFLAPSEALGMGDQLARMRLNEILEELGVCRASFPEAPVRGAEISSPTHLRAAAKEILSKRA